jgi:DNA-binding NarL/FixJ family response regulator
MSALPPAAVRVMLVEPEGLVRNRFAAAICGDARLLLASCLTAGRAALGRLAELRPDVLLAGLALRDLDAVELVRFARRVSCEVLVIAGPGEEADAVRSLAAGAAGCLPRLCGGRDVVAEVLHLRAGGCPMLPAVARLLLERLHAGPSADPGSASNPARNSLGLTARELDVLRSLARGLSYSQTGRSLGLSPHTVASHVKNAYRKLEVHSIGAAVRRAMELGVIGT